MKNEGAKGDQLLAVEIDEALICEPLCDPDTAAAANIGGHHIE